MELTLLTLIGLTITCALVIGSWSGWYRRLVSLSPAVVAMLVGCTFQVVHLAEHLVQLGYWVVHPTSAPWLTPWARSAADSLSTSAVGAEALHLVGNGVFLLTAVALVAITASEPQHRRAASSCLVVQGLHVAEHVALTATVAAGGSAIGVSTLFGALPAGPVAWSYRVLLHFGVNAAATLLALRALRGLASRPRRIGRSPAPGSLRVQGVEDHR